MIRIFSVAALALLLAGPVHAQISPGGGGYGPTGGGGYSPAGNGSRAHNQDDDDHKSAPAEDKPVPPPPAIPGAEPDADAAIIPADRLAAEMSPNDALFDAINRGDLAAAKDALSRGAQLDAKNVLGQTPTDASIDLSRNDITFLLLSMRTGVTAGKPVQTATTAKPKILKAATRRAPVVADRGTPNPAVGFTGF